MRGRSPRTREGRIGPTAELQWLVVSGKLLRELIEDRNEVFRETSLACIIQGRNLARTYRSCFFGENLSKTDAQ